MNLWQFFGWIYGCSHYFSGFKRFLENKKSFSEHNCHGKKVMVCKHRLFFFLFGNPIPVKWCGQNFAINKDNFLLPQKTYSTLLLCLSPLLSAKRNNLKIINFFSRLDEVWVKYGWSLTWIGHWMIVIYQYLITLKESHYFEALKQSLPLDPS